MRFREGDICGKDKSRGRPGTFNHKYRVWPKQLAEVLLQHGHRSVLGESRIAKIDNCIAKFNRTVERSLGKKSQDHRIVERQ